MHFITCYDICGAKNGAFRNLLLFSPLRLLLPQLRFLLQELLLLLWEIAQAICSQLAALPWTVFQGWCHSTKHLPKEAVLTTGNKHKPCCFPEMSSLQRCRGGLLLGNPCKLNSQALSVLLRPMVNLSAMASEGATNMNRHLPTFM